MKSEETAKKLIGIDKKLLKNLDRFNDLNIQRAQILKEAENNNLADNLKARMEQNIADFDHVLTVIKQLEEESNELKKLI